MLVSQWVKWTWKKIIRNQVFKISTTTQVFTKYKFNLIQKLKENLQTYKED